MLPFTVFLSEAYQAPDQKAKELTQAILDPQSLAPLSLQAPNFSLTYNLKPNISKPVTEAMAAAAIPMVVSLLGALQPILGDFYSFVKCEVEEELELSQGSSVSSIFKAAISKLRGKGKIDSTLAKRIQLGVDIANVCKNDPVIVKAADENPLVHSIADFAVQYDTAKITRTIAAAATGTVTPAGIIEAAKEIRAAVFTEAPSATVQGMLMDNKVKLASSDPEVKADLVRVLAEMPPDALVTQPLESLEMAAPAAMQALPLEKRDMIKQELRLLKRVATVAPTTTAMQGLMEKGITNSSQIATVSESQFVMSMAAVMPEVDAVQTHRTATQIVNRNQGMLISWWQLVQGSGLEAIDGVGTPASRLLKVKALAAKFKSSQANLEALFGSMDQCGCNDCSTVYSPAAYLVDLLEYVRTTGIKDSYAPMSLASSGEAPDIRDTVLEKFLRRRPDIGNLQLTCENTNAILPYTDLANEVMESFIVNMVGSASTDFGDPRTRQLTLDAFNVENQDSKELLAEPQNTNTAAYQILAKATSPISLPYHQPIDAQRGFLDLLGVSRHDLLDAFRPRSATVKAREGEDVAKLQQAVGLLQDVVYNRQADAEALGLVQEEYLILTEEVFFPADFFRLAEGIPLSAEDYGARIGLLPTHAYWGYRSAESLNSTDEDTRIGLCFVKQQFLPRSGIAYQELVEIVETGFINPQMPRGRTKRVFDQLRFSYRFLQTLVDNQAADPRRRLGKLADFLVRTTNLARLSELLADTTSGTLPSSRKGGRSACVEDDEVRQWVYDHFEGIGKIITLEMGQGPRLTVTGQVVAWPGAGGDGKQGRVDIGHLADDGSICSAQGVPVAHVNIASRVLYGSASDGATLNDKYRGYFIQVESNTQEILGVVENGFLRVSGPDQGIPPLAQWVLTEGLGGSCNIDSVKLVHLDGSSLTTGEWSRLQKFLRLWKKMGWSIIETDMALTWNRFLDAPIPKPVNPVDDCGCEPSGTGLDLNGSSELITLDHFSPGLKESPNTDNPRNSQAGRTPSNPKVTVDTIHQLSVIKKILALTGLDVEKLLTFWVLIPSRGPKSLYYRLFLTSNVSPNDKRFGPDENGDFFTRGVCKITDNLLIVMAAFGLRATDIDFFLGKTVGSSTDKALTSAAIVPDILNMETLSTIYRHTLLAKVLGIAVPDLGQLLRDSNTLPDPFKSPDDCLSLLQTWTDLSGVGLLWPEFRYVAVDIPTPRDPLAPDATRVLRTAKELYEGAQAIQTQHPRILAAADATEDLVRGKLSLIFGDGEVVEQVLELLGGRIVTVVDAPALEAGVGMVKKVAAVSNRLVYIPAQDGQTAHLQVRGIPSRADEVKLRAVLSPPKEAGDGKENGGANGATPVKSGVEVSNGVGKSDDIAQDAKTVAAWETTVTVLMKCAIERARGIVHDSLDAIVPWKISEKQLLAPDVDEAVVTPGPNQSSPLGSPQQKRFVLTKYLVVFVQNQLTQVLVEETITSAVGFKGREMAKAILNNVSMEIYGADGSEDTDEQDQEGVEDGIPTDETPPEITAMEFLLEYLRSDDSSGSDEQEWTGYLTPTATGSYNFLVFGETTPSPITLDNKPYTFQLQQEYPQRLYVTKQSVKLESGKLYTLDLLDLPPSQLQWKPASGARVPVPGAILLPRRAQDELYKVFTGLQAAAIIIDKFRLSVDEVLYIYNHREDFGDVKFVGMRAEQLKRLLIYIEFRDSLPKNAELKLIDLFSWAKHHDASKQLLIKANPTKGKPAPTKAELRAELIGKIAAATSWKEQQISQIMDHAAFASTAIADYRNSLLLRQFTRLLALSDKLKVEIPRLFSWAKPLGTSVADFSRLHAMAEDMRRVARSRFGLQNFSDAVRPVSDRLRENQRRSLVSYLLVQDEITSLDIYDADGLFEYFLIDPQMTPLVETSRIKQAIATVQVYVQRCLLGLEEPYGVPLGVLDRKRWDWMQKYRTWEANRKVFLYPENWIEPSLRDDKSEFFTELESALTQKDLTMETVSQALKAYLYSVSEVSNLVVAGLCVDYTTGVDRMVAPVHVFARTQTAPFTFYYNVFRQGNWKGWSKMQIDIPHYSQDNLEMPASSASTGAAGVHLSPLAFNGRVVVFIPQIVKKTGVTKHEEEMKFEKLGKESITVNAPIQGWEIKMSWTELRNNSWTPRQLCPDGLVDWVAPLTSIDRYFFVPVETRHDPSNPWREAKLCVYRRSEYSFELLGLWSFGSGRLSYQKAQLLRIPFRRPTTFGYNSDSDLIGLTHSYQAIDEASSTFEAAFLTDASPPYAVGPENRQWQQGAEIKLQGDDSQLQPLYDPRLGQLMSSSARSSSSSSLELLTLLGAVGDDVNSAETQKLLANSFGRTGDGSFNELGTPCALYNWELGLHGPMLIINQLLEAQQFEQALDVCHYVFNPLAKGGENGDRDSLSRFWVFAPFKHSTQTQSLEVMFQELGLEENKTKAKATIDEWRDNPFSPHAVARRRPRAYMIWMVMTYIKILIQYGDYYFRQNTLETVPNAIQMYILASHLYGPRGYKAKRPRPSKAHTYNSLVTKFDAFSNALVQMEEAFPFSNQTPLPVGKLPESPESYFSNILGFAGGLLFSIPENPELRALGETIDDRLFKLRHSQDIKGLFRKLPLFEPPIDPRLLVQAQAQGLSLTSVLNDLSGGPMPNYRFQHLLGRALELANEVKTFGQALLSAQEKRDGEAYALLRAKHEVATQNMIAEMKTLSLDEAQRGLEALQYSRNGPVNRMRYYLQLTGEELSAVPEAMSEFQQLSEKLQKPVEDGGLRLLPLEKEEMDLSREAVTLSIASGSIESIAGILGAIPDIGTYATPLGVGGNFNIGGSQFASAASGAARAINTASSALSSKSGMAGRKAIALRSLNDRLQQVNIAGFDISHIDKQIVAAKVRVAMASREIENQQKQTAQARDAEEFLRSKYTSAELYAWVFGQTKTLFYSSYTQAYDVAKNVEKLLKFERPQLASQTFIQQGYWNAARDGLLAGEALYHGLKQLETAYVADRGYDYEVTRHVSMRQIDPRALLLLRDTGTAEFSIPEVSYDLDFPGHYMRRIKSVAVTIPCVVGPYSGINCTLRLLSHKYRVSPSAAGGYPESVATAGSLSDTRFSTTNVPISAIAVSSGQADAGVFDFSLGGERYLPFEGAGAISKWRLELPTGVVRPFDYSTITDVILTVRYTSCEGGMGLRAAAEGAVADFARAAVETGNEGGLYALIDVRSEYANEWARFVRKPGPDTGGGPSIRLDRLGERLPLYVLAKDKAKIVAQDIWVVVDGKIKGDNMDLSIAASGDPSRVVQLSKAPKAGSATSELVHFAPSGPKAELAVDEWRLTVDGDTTGLKRMWVVVRYRLP